MEKMFIKKLNDFLGHPWSRPEEKAIVSNLIKSRQEINDNPVVGQNMIKSIIVNNANTIELCSIPFQEEFCKLPSIMINEDYSMAWDDVSVCIEDKYKVPLSIETVLKIKNLLAGPKYGKRLNIPTNKPQEEIIILKFPISMLVPLSMDLRKINKELVATPKELNSINHDISAKVNKEERMKRREMGLSEGYGTSEEILNARIAFLKKLAYTYDISCAESINKYNKNKEVLFYGSAKDFFEQKRKGAFIQITEPTGFDEETDTALTIGIAVQYGTSASGNNTHLGVTYLVNHNESQLKQMINENTTADISVPDSSALASKQMVKRANSANVYGEDNDEEIPKVDGDFLNENNIDVDKMFIKEHNLDQSGKFSKVIVEGAYGDNVGKIDRNDFMRFVTRNVDVNDYMVENKFAFKKFMREITPGRTQTIFKEYFKRMLNESSHELEINNVELEGDKIYISYYYGDEPVQVVTVSEEDFEDFIRKTQHNYVDYVYHDNAGNEDYPNGFGDYFDFDAYWSHQNINQQNTIVKSFLIHRMMGSEKMVEETYSDYSKWKERLMESTNHDYLMSSEQKMLIARNSKGNKVGTWDTNSKKGIIYN